MKINNEELNAVSAVSTNEEPRYVAIGGSYKVVPKDRLRAARWNVTKHMRPVTQCAPDTWVDTETGEVITKTDAKKRGIKLPMARSISDKALDLCERVAACTPSERPFVGFLLNMRNHRGGLVASLDSVLDRWIDSECPGIRTTNRARKREQLRAIIERRKLMASDTAMAKDLMLLNPNVTKQEVLEERAKLFNSHYLPALGTA
jgi:hypothetical protein